MVFRSVSVSVLRPIANNEGSKRLWLGFVPNGAGTIQIQGFGTAAGWETIVSSVVPSSHWLLDGYVPDSTISFRCILSLWR